MSWIVEHRVITQKAIAGAGWPELPLTPPCRHVKQHKPRPIETRADFVDYMVFRVNGWEDAGYCWSYMPAFLHEWFGCGPDQELFRDRREAPVRPSDA